jgi:hypothetical protein
MLLVTSKEKCKLIIAFLYYKDTIKLQKEI